MDLYKNQNMKINVLTSEKDLLKVEFDKKDEGFLNLIKKYVWKDKATELAGYKIDHPEVGKPVFVLKTKGKAAKTVWNDALKAAKKDIEDFEKELKKIK